MKILPKLAIRRLGLFWICDMLHYTYDLYVTSRVTRIIDFQHHIHSQHFKHLCIVVWGGFTWLPQN